MAKADRTYRSTLLQIGLEPTEVDYAGSRYQALGPLDEEWMKATLEDDLALLRETGVEVELVFVSPQSRLVFSATPEFTRDEINRWFGTGSPVSSGSQSFAAPTHDRGKMS